MTSDVPLIDRLPTFEYEFDHVSFIEFAYFPNLFTRSLDK